MTSAERFARLEDLFHSASTLSGDDRQRFLADASRTDPGLDAELRALMASFDGMEVEPAPNLAAPSETTGKRVGPYELKHLLGRGGMGAVYLARRADGQFDQQVALKVMASNLPSDQFLARFVTERQLLAHMSHPNITHLLDGGVADDGLPYIAMEYVDGLPIDCYCDSRTLPVADRVRLFLQVCDAVSYAHRNLVVHRDLKPSNVLVTASGQAKLLDFGTAKLLVSDGEMTGTGLLLTPRYASPEQLRGLPISTRSDVYSLGVTLFELLSGTGPFGESSGVLEELFRLAENRLPDPLGAKLGEGAETKRGLSRDELRRLLSGDLRQVLSKCLQSDPEVRYSSVDALSQDLRAWLDHRPVQARPLTLLYRTRLLARRRWRVLAVSMATLAAIAAGIVGTISQQRLAARRFNDGRLLARYQMFDLYDDLTRVPGTARLRTQIVERSITLLDKLSAREDTDPGLAAELAEGYLRTANLLGNPQTTNLGDPIRAREAYRKARAMAQKSRRPDARRTLAMVELFEGLLDGFASRDAEFEKAADHATAILNTAIAANSTDPDNYIYLGDVLQMRGQRRQNSGGAVATEDLSSMWYGKARQAYAKAAQNGGKSADIDLRRIQLDYRQANTRGSVSPQHAADGMRAVLEAVDGLPPATRRQANFRLLEAQILAGYGWTLGQLGRYPEAIERSHRARDIMESLAAAEPGEKRIKYELTVVYRGLGIISNYSNRPLDAIAHFERAAALHDEILAGGPNLVSEFYKGELLRRQAEQWLKLRDKERANRVAGQAAVVLRGLAERPEPVYSHLEGVVAVIANPDFSTVYDPASAVHFARKAHALRPGQSAEILARALLANGEIEEAERVAEPLATMLRATTPQQASSRYSIALRELLDEIAAAKGKRKGASKQ